MTIIFLLSPFIIGFLRREHFRHIPHTTHPVILVQTNQSELKSHPTPVDWEKINDVFKKIDLSNTPLIVFPEYTSTASNPKFQDFIKDLGRRGKFDLVIGVKDTAGGELINEAWHLNQNGKVSSSGKLLGFPIGEAKLNLPFIPKSWLRAQIPIAQSHAIENFKTPALKLKTLICYDATFSKNYRSSKESALSVIVNISKDSHLQNTSAIDWLDLVVRAKMSLSGKSGIRVSSNSYTEIVTPWGESLQVSNKNQFQVIQTQFVVYP